MDFLIGDYYLETAIYNKFENSRLLENHEQLFHFPDVH